MLHLQRNPVLLVFATLLVSLAACNADTEPPRGVGATQASLWANARCDAAGEDGRYFFRHRRVGVSSWGETAKMPYRCTGAGDLQAAYTVTGLAAGTQYEYLFCASVDHARVSGALWTYRPPVTACFDQNRDGDLNEPQRFTTAATASSSAKVFVSAGGSGTACTQAAPCGTFSAAYAKAAAGDTIQVNAGTYPAQGNYNAPCCVGSKAVTFKAQPGVKVRLLATAAANTTWDGFDLDANGGNPGASVLEFAGANATFKNGRIGNVIDQKGATATSACVGCTFDNVVFHDVTIVNQSIHSECIYSQAANLTVKNSRFEHECGSTGGIFLTRGTWWGQPIYGGWTFLNNFFEPQLYQHGGLIFSEHLGGVIDRAVIRGNTFQGPVVANGSFKNSVESCNTPPGSLNFPGISHQPC